MPEPLNRVVVPREACRKGFTPADCIDVNEHSEPTCAGCMKDGTRAVLDQAQEVERGEFYDGFFESFSSGRRSLDGRGMFGWREVDR